METQYVGGRVLEVKQETRNGVPVGIVAGHIAAWEPDQGGRFGVPDRFHPGAFLKSIAEHVARDNRQVRLKDHHGRTIGGFPIETVHEDEIGLFGRGEINLEVQQGREAFALARQRVLTDFSIGFISISDTLGSDFRDIFEAQVVEGSTVDDPLNKGANITEVKAVVPFQDLPLASRDRAWDSDAAVARVKDFTDSEDEPSIAYRRGFLWHNRDVADAFEAFRLPVADVVDGTLAAVPDGIFAAAVEMKSDLGGTDMPESVRTGVIRHIERYYAKMDLASPFDENDKSFYTAAEVETFTIRDVQRVLRAGGCSKKAAARLADQFGAEDAEPEIMRDVLEKLQEIRI